MPYVDVNSGDLHRRLGGYPSQSHQMPTCCSVMWSIKGPGDEVMSQPPSGKGATLTIRYQTPRHTSHSRTPTGEQEELAPLATDTSVSLEQDLESHVLANLEQLEPGLRLYADEHGSGQQLDTGEVGRLDILAVDKDDRFVVIELRAGTADDTVCAQLLRYLGWVRSNLAGGREPRGLLVANDFTKSLEYAAEALDNVALIRYQTDFEFSEVSRRSWTRELTGQTSESSTGVIGQILRKLVG